MYKVVTHSVLIIVVTTQNLGTSKNTIRQNKKKLNKIMHRIESIFISSVFKWLSLLLVVPAILTISCNKGSPNLASQPQDIPVVKVIQMDVPIYREFVGQLYGAQDIPVRARVEGFLEGIHFQEGSTVKKGSAFIYDRFPTV